MAKDTTTSIRSQSPWVFQVIALICVLAPLLAGATTTEPGQGGSTTEIRGLRYWLPADVVVVDVTVTTTTTREVVVRTCSNPGGTEPKKPCSSDEGPFEIRPQTRVTYQGALGISAVADRSKPAHVLDMPPMKTKDVGLVVEVSPGGLLRSVAPYSRGRGGDITKSVATFVATVAATAAGIPVPVSKLSRDSFTNLAKDPRIRKYLGEAVAGKYNIASTARDPAADYIAGAATPPVAVCDPMEPPYSLLPIRLRAFLHSSGEGCELFLRVLASQNTVDELQDARQVRAGKVSSASPEELKKLKVELAEIDEQLQPTQKALSGYQARLNALVGDWASSNDLGEKLQTEKFTQVFTPGQLNVDSEKLNLDKPCTLAEKFAARSGVAVTARPVWGNGAEGDKVAEPLPPADEKPGKSQRIYFREGQPYLFELRTCPRGIPDSLPIGTEKKCTFALQDRVFTDVVPAGSVSSYIQFDPSAWSDRKLALVFDEHGRPAKLELSSTASAAALVSALSDGAQQLRDTYATTLDKMVDIQKSQQDLALADVNAKIAAATKAKDLLDAQAKLAGTTATYDLALKQQALQAEIDLLKVQQTQVSAQATQETLLEVEKLKAELARLQQELSVLKARQALEGEKK